MKSCGGLFRLSRHILPQPSLNRSVPLTSAMSCSGLISRDSGCLTVRVSLSSNVEPPENLGLSQCSKRSRAPVGPCGGTSKSPRRDETAQGSPPPSVNSQAGRHYKGRRAPRCETISGRGRLGVTKDDEKQRKATGDDGGRQMTTGTVGDDPSFVHRRLLQHL